MAITGSGTELDPYVVHDWDEFLTVKSDGVYVKFANPHEVNGEIILSGTGIQTDPYIVSSYEEMLFATGATYIWQCKLIDRELKIYRYNDIYCHYDDSLSTIDFNLIQPEGYTSMFNISSVTNLNGWTWKNAVFHDYGYFYFHNPVSNAIFENFFSDNEESSYGCCISCYGQASNIKMSGTFDTDGNGIFGVRSASNSAYRGLINSSFNFKLLGKSKMFTDSGNRYSPNMENCNINFELVDNRESAVNLNNEIGCHNCLINGVIKAPNCTHDYTGSQLMRYNSKYSIINIKADVEEGQNRPYLNITGTSTNTNLNLYVNDGNVDYYIKDGSNIVGISESTLKDAQALRDLGLPIGVVARFMSTDWS